MNYRWKFNISYDIIAIDLPLKTTRLISQIATDFAAFRGKSLGMMVGLNHRRIKKRYIIMVSLWPSSWVHTEDTSHQVVVQILNWSYWSQEEEHWFPEYVSHNPNTATYPRILLVTTDLLILIHPRFGVLSFNPSWSQPSLVFIRHMFFEVSWFPRKSQFCG